MRKIVFISLMHVYFVSCNSTTDKINNRKEPEITFCSSDKHYEKSYFDKISDTQIIKIFEDKYETTNFSIRFWVNYPFALKDYLITITPQKTDTTFNIIEYDKTGLIPPNMENAKLIYSNNNIEDVKEIISVFNPSFNWNRIDDSAMCDAFDYTTYRLEIIYKSNNKIRYKFISECHDNYYLIKALHRYLAKYVKVK